MYPRIVVNVEKLKMNLEEIKKLLNKRKLTLTMVTKAYCANIDIASTLVNTKLIDYIGDSRISNLKRLKDLDVEKNTT